MRRTSMRPHVKLLWAIGIGMLVNGAMFTYGVGLTEGVIESGRDTIAFEYYYRLTLTRFYDQGTISGLEYDERMTESYAYEIEMRSEIRSLTSKLTMLRVVQVFSVGLGASIVGGLTASHIRNLGRKLDRYT